MHTSISSTSADSRLGNAAFDLVLRSPQCQSPQDALLLTYAQFPGIFTDCERILSPAAWRLVRCGPKARWSLLCDATFDVRSEITRLGATAADDGPLSDWIGDAPQNVSAGIPQQLEFAEGDACKAAFLVIAWVQSIQLDPASQMSWWQHDVWRGLLEWR